MRTIEVHGSTDLQAVLPQKSGSCLRQLLPIVLSLTEALKLKGTDHMAFGKLQLDTIVDEA